MNLIKTSLLNGIAVFIKMATLLGINKVLAIYVGPSGYAAIGQLQNALQIFSTFASGAITNGVIKYTAEYNENTHAQIAIWRTAGSISLIGSLTLAVFILIFSGQMAQWFLQDEKLAPIFNWFAITLVFMVFNSLLLSVLNGKKEIKLYVIANISGSLFALLFTTLLTVSYGIYGALIALAIYQSLAFFVTLSLVWRTDWFRFDFFYGSIDSHAVRNLFKFTLMALATACCIPLSQIIIRNHLMDYFGMEYAGYWEAIWRLSAAYLMLITTTLSVYFLPRFSELTDMNMIRREILNSYKLITPVLMITCCSIYLFRDIIISTLFTEGFAQARVLFAGQMVGDFFKICAWIIGYVFISKAQVKMFISMEIGFSALLCGLTYFFTEHQGFIGVSIAYAVNYFIYFICVLIILNTKKNEH